MESKHFSEDEFRCKCCGALPPEGIDQNLVNLLDDMRDAVGGPLNLNCGYRCAAHNAEVGGVPNSQHNANPCTAADIDATDVGVEVLAQIAEAAGADGIGRYENDKFLHVDTRSGRIGDTYRWDG
jgi:uncharacterized protein YcbK (DUF882 family)